MFVSPPLQPRERWAPRGLSFASRRQRRRGFESMRFTIRDRRVFIVTLGLFSPPHARRMMCDTHYLQDLFPSIAPVFLVVFETLKSHCLREVRGLRIPLYAEGAGEWRKKYRCCELFANY